MPKDNGLLSHTLTVKKAVLLCAVLYFCFMIIRLPADRVWPEVLKRAGVAGQVSVQNGEGSWLVGTFNDLVVSGNNIGKVSWRLKPLYFLTGAVRFALDLKKGEDRFSGDLKLSPWSIGLQDVNGEASVDLISKIAGFPGIELSGVIKASDLDIALKKGMISSAEGGVSWWKAGLKKPYALTAGNFEAVLKTDPEGVKINATDKGGDVILRVAGTITPDGKYGLNGELGTRDSADPDLVSFLKILGEPGPNGRVRLSRRGQLKKLTR